MIKRNTKAMQGVTLLEIMLVLAIAAMVIVMSIRYYGAATASQQANATIEQIQAITAAADSVGQNAGGYTSSNLTTSTITALLPANGMATAWVGGSITVAYTSATTYTVTINKTPAGVCQIVRTKLSSNSRYTNLATCAATGTTTFSYIYDATK